jgi:hypothetical protein
MKPYAFDPNLKNDTGCCPGHDWPVCYRWAGKYRSSRSLHSARDRNKAAKRARRRRDKMGLGKEVRPLEG